ncbi:MAG: hypothetical protein HZA91_07640 [Verrucomicrobia bacterium]|nr:hypothetical protein [Verrucomicrobiota bacterium]
MRRHIFQWLLIVAAGLAQPRLMVAAAGHLRVGAAAVEFEADDTMEIGGSILAGHVRGQEGKLRAVAVVLEQAPVKLAVVACDVLMLNRDLLDPVAAEIERTTGIPAAHVLINCTHTHHAPSTCTVHGYKRDEEFCRRVQRGIAAAVRAANANLAGDSRFCFALGEEKTVGQNSRLLLGDGTIYWGGPRDDAVRPTGPFDPALPVLAFRDVDGKLQALLFNHSTHTIRGRKGGVRSPGFYGMAAQELEAEMGATVGFLEGASGSTHNLDLSGDECADRIKRAVREALAKAQPQAAARLAAIKRPFKFRVRRFDEAKEDEAVSSYCRKRMPPRADSTIAVFRAMRRELAPRQGEERETWMQVMRIGDVAIVGVPAEYFTALGLDIKKRSPFPHTLVAELANDWIGYLPDREGHKLGGYQTWTGLHSYAEPGTGERIADEAVAMLRELRTK